MKRKNKKRGFTLIEIMVVVAIIAIIAGMLMINIRDFMQRGRDSVRIANLDVYLKAIHMRYAETGLFPTGDDSGIHLDSDCASNFQTDLVGGNYLPSNMPTDPRGEDTDCADNSDTAYFYGWDSLHTCDGSKYCISINLMETDYGRQLLQEKFGALQSTTCGPDANIDNADFNYCLSTP